MGQKDDEEWEAIRRRRQAERDAARERALWASAAEEQAQLSKDDADWEKTMKDMLKGVDKVIPADDVDKLLNEALKDARKKLGRKPTPAQKDALKRALNQRKKQRGGCAVIGFLILVGLGGAVYATEELARSFF